jgi:hypothetical protein
LVLSYNGFVAGVRVNAWIGFLIDELVIKPGKLYNLITKYINWGSILSFYPIFSKASD